MVRTLNLIKEPSLPEIDASSVYEYLTSNDKPPVIAASQLVQID